MNLEQTTRLVQFLASVYTTWKPTEGTYGAWALVLGDQDPASIGEAALRWTREAKPFPPTPGELLQLGRPASSTTSGSEAWEELIREVRRTGYYGQPAFRDDKLARCVGFLGGWQGVCSQLTSEVAANRARFIAHYDALATREHAIDSAMSVRSLVEDSGPLLKRLGLGGSSRSGPRRLIDPDPESSP